MSWFSFTESFNIFLSMVVDIEKGILLIVLHHSFIQYPNMSPTDFSSYLTIKPNPVDGYSRTSQKETLKTRKNFK